MNEFILNLLVVYTCIAVMMEKIFIEFFLNQFQSNSGIFPFSKNLGKQLDLQILTGYFFQFFIKKFTLIFCRKQINSQSAIGDNGLKYCAIEMF